MIAPRTRLLVLTAALLPLLVLSSPVTHTVSALFGLFALVALADAAFAIRFGRNFSIDPEGLFRLARRDKGEISVRLLNHSGKRALIRAALAFPEEIESERSVAEVEVPDAGFSIVRWPVKPTRRGLFRIASGAIDVASPLGLWRARRECACNLELRVYPNLRRDSRGLAAHFKKGAAGIHAMRLVGKGREFERLREYVPGDSIHDIHWKATAKRGVPVTKVFQMERTQDIYAVIDTSRLSARNEDEGEGKEMVIEKYLAAALLLGASAQRNGDNFGICAFSDRIEQFVRARSGKEHFGACRDSVYQLEPRLVNPDYRELFSFLKSRIRRRALIMIFTEPGDSVLAESLSESIDLLTRQHLVVVNMIRTPGAERLFMRELAEGESVHDRLAGHYVWSELRELEKSLLRRGVRFEQIAKESLTVSAINRYLDVKRRQAL